MKKLLALALALIMVLGLAVCAQAEEYKMACYWPAPDTFFDSYVLKGIEAFEAEYGQVRLYQQMVFFLD